MSGGNLVVLYLEKNLNASRPFLVIGSTPSIDQVKRSTNNMITILLLLTIEVNHLSTQ